MDLGPLLPLHNGLLPSVFFFIYILNLIFFRGYRCIDIRLENVSELNNPECHFLLSSYTYNLFSSYFSGYWSLITFEFNREGIVVFIC
jgi:hypothetical protein